MGQEKGPEWSPEHGWPQQDAPIPNDKPAVWDLVLADLGRINLPYPQQQYIKQLLIVDIKRRDQAGEKKYGVRLQPCNGRNALVDAYEESLDAIVYMRQELEELTIANSLIITNERTTQQAYILETYFTQIEISLRLRFAIKNKEKINGTTDSTNNRDSQESGDNQSNIITP